ncbi:hypothetical protein JKF63_03527 [Porcisia hertigi]|uniref:Uncharacterized protein n=1 Tax=Porcisia hertigi TaxID=2761500 RepID=A0A836L6S0_9TRYP|nr:hypothetical protein JKF63_03527 [Porcisia hertigi]
MFVRAVERTPVRLGASVACLGTLSHSVVLPHLQTSSCNCGSVTSVCASAATRRAVSTLTPSTSLCDTLCTARRWAAMYPKASRKQVRTARRKDFNYLTADRLVPSEKKLSRVAIRNRDDAGLRRRREYKQQLIRDVEEKIRFFPPNIKKQVFFPLMTNSPRLSLFRGNREYGIRLCTRVFSMLLDQLCKRENRGIILERCAELGWEPPTAEDWERYTDSVTGDITTGIMYSKWVNAILTTYGRMFHTGSTQLIAGGSSTLFAYVIRNYSDRTLVPPLEDWSRQFGPVIAEEFVGRPRGQEKFNLAMSNAVIEVRSWGRLQAQEAVSRLSLQEQDDLVQWVEQNIKSHIADMERKNAFSAKVLAVMHSLPEAKAIRTSFWSFKESKRLEHVVKQNGAFYPLVHDVRKAWSSMSKEEKARYSCFGQKIQSETACGRKLFLRYCCRDYGFSLIEASRRFNALGELQKAALEFPFYLPLTPSNASTAAFRRFYHVMCERYGMVRTYNNGVGNRLFMIAMRHKWDGLSMEERQQYEERDRIYSVFPLQPTPAETVESSCATSSSLEALPAKTTSLTPSPGAEAVVPRWGKPFKGSAVQVAPAKVGPQYFVEERPPSLKVEETSLTAEALLKNLREVAYANRRRAFKKKEAPKKPEVVPYVVYPAVAVKPNKPRPPLPPPKKQPAGSAASNSKVAKAPVGRPKANYVRVEIPGPPPLKRPARRHKLEYCVLRV